MRTYYFTVTGAGAFPFNCLWADQAWPASLADCERIEYACPRQAPPTTIRLASFKHPTPAAWGLNKWRLDRIEA
jgi:hypothetical protein